MSFGSPITASRFNLLQNRIASILGNGTSTNGYGQGLSGYGGRVSSSEVSRLNESLRNIATAENINQLYIDILRARIHQIGLDNNEITPLIRNARLIQNQSLIADEISNFFISGNPILIDSNGVRYTEIDPDGALKGMSDFERLMSLVEENKFEIHSSMSVSETGNSIFRVRPWDYKLIHEVVVRFRNANHRRHFFNSGGVIEMSAILENPNGQKSLDWAQLLSTAGKVQFGHNYTASTSDDTVQPPVILSDKGNYQLSETYDTYLNSGVNQPLYKKQSRGEYSSGQYIDNSFSVSAKSVSSTEIQFRMVFDDAATDSTANVVNGTLRSVVGHVRSKGTFPDLDDIYLNVEVPAPYYENITTF